jgi:hypothetical protein
MAFQVQLISGTKSWVTPELRSVAATGPRSPHLLIDFLLRTPSDRVAVQLHHVRVWVFGADELLGEGAIVGVAADFYPTSCVLDVPVTHRMMRYVTESLPTNADAALKLKWSGILRVKSDQPLEDAKPGEWTFVSITETEMNIVIPRSDWFGKVLQPIADDEYVFLEVAVPKGPAAIGWRKALDLLDEAEKAYAIGDDAGVFAKLRGAVDALPGAKQQIVDALPEPRRAEVNALLLAVGEYLHHGRHVATEGAEAGKFPVNRIDADAALSMVRVMFSYVSRAIAAANPAAS